jgi:hypothetical protein
MEEEIAALMDAMSLGYDDVYRMPYSRRQRLIQWKEDQVRKQQQLNEAAARRR